MAGPPLARFLHRHSRRKESERQAQIFFRRKLPASFSRRLWKRRARCNLRGRRVFRNKVLLSESLWEDSRLKARASVVSLRCRLSAVCLRNRPFPRRLILRSSRTPLGETGEFIEIEED